MSDLISRKELIKALETAKSSCRGLHEYVFFDAVMAIVDNQPTAYDVYKVVEQLNHLLNNFGEHCEEYENSECTHKSCSDCILSHGIDIVKGGLEE